MPRVEHDRVRVTQKPQANSPWREFRRFVIHLGGEVGQQLIQIVLVLVCGEPLGVIRRTTTVCINCCPTSAPR